MSYVDAGPPAQIPANLKGRKNPLRPKNNDKPAVPAERPVTYLRPIPQAPSPSPGAFRVSAPFPAAIALSAPSGPSRLDPRRPRSAGESPAEGGGAEDVAEVAEAGIADVLRAVRCLIGKDQWACRLQVCVG